MLTALLRDAQHIFFPHNCFGCGTDVLNANEDLCVRCLHELPYTEFEKFINNPVERLFHGRVPVKSAYSALYFNKGTLVQELMHAFKYKGRQNLAEYLGSIMGRQMQDSARFEVEAILPLPLFAAKQHKRGYNQAQLLAQGIGRVLHVPVIQDVLFRHKATETQTKKHRAERWQNVDESFSVIDGHTIEGKHVLLVDDVLTTGATLDAASQVLLPYTTQISIATLAYASK